MDKILITGIGGLIGSACADLLSKKYFVIGIDNDIRQKLLKDKSASVKWNLNRLEENKNIVIIDSDVRKRFLTEHKDIIAIIHCAAQTAHEGSLSVDFDINVNGTLNMLSFYKDKCPEAKFIYLSTIKVYGDFPNTIEYKKEGHRLVPRDKKYCNGFDESIPLGQGISSFFGRSKTCADLYVQEYGYQYDLETVCLRPGCVTGKNHMGTEGHGMLSYMIKCAITDKPYSIYGFNGYQVRDQIHADDVAEAIKLIIEKPYKNNVYNIGGGIDNSCSMIEAINEIQKTNNRDMSCKFKPGRVGDHAFWVTDNSRLKNDYPSWNIKKPLVDIYNEIYASKVKHNV